MATIEIIKSTSGFGTEIYCFKPLEDCDTQKSFSDLESLATLNVDGPKLCKFDAKGRIYDPRLDAHDIVSKYWKTIFPDYPDIEYDLPFQRVIGLVTTKEYLKNIIHQLFSEKGYSLKTSSGRILTPI